MIASLVVHLTPAYYVSGVAVSTGILFVVLLFLSPRLPAPRYVRAAAAVFFILSAINIFSQAYVLLQLANIVRELVPEHRLQLLFAGLKDIALCVATGAAWVWIRENRPTIKHRHQR